MSLLGASWEPAGSLGACWEPSEGVLVPCWEPGKPAGTLLGACQEATSIGVYSEFVLVLPRAIELLKVRIGVNLSKGEPDARGAAVDRAPVG